MNARKVVVPKGGFEKGVAKMKTHEIDDLLNDVSPSLIAEYEAKNLNGTTLRAVNEEYKIFCKKDGSFKLGLLIPTAMILLGVSLASALAFGPNNSAPALLLVVFLVVVWISYPASKQQEEHLATLASYEKFLGEFREAVRALSHSNGWVSYTEDWIHEALIYLASQLLDAERDFKQVRMRENVLTIVVVACGDNEMRRCKKFGKMLMAAEKFGLTFNKREIFAEAKARKVLDEAFMK